MIRVALAIALVLISSCAPVPSHVTPTRTPPAGGALGGTLRLAQSAAPRTFDPWRATDAGSRQVLAQVFETLVVQDATGTRFVPGLAAGWEVSTDQRTWTFTIRGGVRFHDGTALDASAVALHLERAWQRAHPLRGGEGYDLWAVLWAGFDGASALERVEVKGPLALSLTTRVPFGPLLAALAHPGAGIVSPASVLADPAWRSPETGRPAGTGPYLISTVEPGGVTLQRNPTYWARDESGRPLPYLDRITFSAVPDPATRLAALRTGAFDGVLDVGATELSAARSDPNLRLVAHPPSGVLSLGIGRRGPLADVSVRRAVAQAVDRQALARALGAGSPASQLVLPGSLGYDDTVTEFAREDEAAARRAVADATAGRGFDAELAYPAAAVAVLPDPRGLAESIAADLAQVGIRATPRGIDAASLRTRAASGNLDLWLEVRVPEAADPAFALDPQLADLPQGPPFADQATGPHALVAALLHVARTETQEPKRAELYKQVSKIAREDVMRIPLLYTATSDVVTRKVQGRSPSARGLEPLARCWLAR